MNDAESAPSPNRFCRKFGMRNAALNASAASDWRPKYRAKNAWRISPVTRLRKMPAATKTALFNVLVRRHRLAKRAARLLHQIRLDEAVQIAVEHAVHVPDLFLGPVVLHQLIRMKDITANLAAEGDVLLGAADLIQPRLLLLHFQIVESRLQDFHRRIAVAVLRPLVLARHD